MRWLVEHRQVDLGEVDEFDVELVTGGRDLIEPLRDRDRDPDTSRTRAAENDLEEVPVCDRSTLQVSSSCTVRMKKSHRI
jgi:hypothetical protein